ncbi:DUF1254 domain-containing protein [Paraburkholderia sp. Ac-20340]|uniref:DUF1254 domain-containing protein n=1 Tax=Paraburkholderia sp. Ac-20340 TaxID=2703888 RepID=UPI00197F6B91|nr:DUF1254 domain-containing protein [Paraburkholderia sp. Ac-20340]MBN3852261.1 DUF1254 domain-containing protein [Paraburkholderia sp. Ac-20340]
MKQLARLSRLAAAMTAMGFASIVFADARYKMTTPLPPQILTPSTVETRIGKLEFTDGVPTPSTAQLVYDNLDFQRGVEAFLNGIPGASLVAMREGIRSFGADNGTIALAETLTDSRTLLLTANTESVYFFGWLDLKNGPVVVEGPPNVLGVIDDFWFRYVADFGNAGPDRGKGGKFLVVPPDYKGELPTSGYFIVKSRTYGNVVVGRGFLKDGSPAPTAANIKAHLRVYPYSQRNNPPQTHFVNSSGAPINTIHSNDFSFYEEINQIVQEEPAGAYGPDMTGIFRSIGIEKGKPFAPDARMKKILTESVAVGNATARAIDFATRDPAARIYPDRHWNTPFIGGSYQWLANGARNFDARTMFFYAATVDTPAMAVAMPGVGSQYASANLDASGRPFDGGKDYVLHVPANVPAKDFWSIVVYDTQTRSMLQTDQQFPSVSSQKDLKANADGSYDVYFGPKAPAGKDSNWIQTIPGKSWFTIFRLYGPLQPWFDKTWKLEDIGEASGK